MLDNVEPYQIAKPSPFGSIFWGGTPIADRLRPSQLREAALSKLFKPVISSYHWNITQDRICSGGKDTLDELWYQASSYNMTNWALWLGEMLEFYHAHNAQSAQVIVTNTAVTTGAAAATLTCAAGHAYKVVFASTKNDTRATTITVVLTPSGGTAATVIDTAANTGAQGVAHPLIGGMGLMTGVASHLGGGNFNGALWLQAGDTLTITQGSYVGGDTVEHNFVYEDYTL